MNNKFVFFLIVFIAALILFNSTAYSKQLNQNILSAKKRVWIDTDSANEVDDYFAIVDVLISPEFLVEGISSAHYGNRSSNDVVNSQNVNEEILIKLNLIEKIIHPIGASHPLTDEFTPKNSPAATAIIERAKAGSSENKLLIFILGPATNVASALLLDPTIADKIEILFIGCQCYGTLTANDFNVENDPDSFTALINSNANITIMPGKPVSEQLKFDKERMAAAMNGKDAIWQYLYDRWHNFGGHTIRTMWDISIIEAVKKPATAVQSTERYNSRDDLLVYTDIHETEMENNFYTDVAAFQETGIGCSTLADSGMPVELTSFTVKIIDDQILLEWQCATEINNYGFEIEKQNSEFSSRELEWERVGFVSGNGNSNSPTFYSYIDEKGENGKFEYRLKQIDNDGKYQYSNIVEINVSFPVKFNLEQNYPNPFNPVTKIKFSVPNVTDAILASKTNTTLKIYDILGNEISTLVNEQKAAGSYEVEFNGSDLASGVYFYKLQFGNYSKTQKMILTK